MACGRHSAASFEASEVGGYGGVHASSLRSKPTQWGLRPRGERATGLTRSKPSTVKSA